MHMAPKSASSRIHPSAGSKVWLWIQSIIRRSESDSETAGERLNLPGRYFARPTRSGDQLGELA
jgi:hypothetical protein